MRKGLVRVTSVGDSNCISLAVHPKKSEMELSEHEADPSGSCGQAGVESGFRVRKLIRKKEIGFMAVSDTERA